MLRLLLKVDPQLSKLLMEVIKSRTIRWVDCAAWRERNKKFKQEFS
jgi:hypothetical protein